MICTFDDRRLLAGRNMRLCSSCERTTANEFSLPEHQSMATRTILQMQDCSCFMVMLDFYPMSLHPCEILLFVWYFCRHLCLSIKSLSTFSFFFFFSRKGITHITHSYWMKPDIAYVKRFIIALVVDPKILYMSIHRVEHKGFTMLCELRWHQHRAERYFIKSLSPWT